MLFDYLLGLAVSYYLGLEELLLGLLVSIVLGPAVLDLFAVFTIHEWGFIMGMENQIFILTFKYKIQIYQVNHQINA